MDTDQEVTRTRHQMKVPGIGVLIAPNAVGRLFTLHDYTKCPRFTKKRMPRVLYPILLPTTVLCPSRVKRRFEW